MSRNEEARSRAWRQEEQAARAIPAVNQKPPVQLNGNSTALKTPPEPIVAPGRPIPPPASQSVSTAPHTPAYSSRNDDYLSPLRSERGRVVSLFGASVTGELLGIAKYQIRVRQPEGGDVVILKSGIWTVEEVKR